VSAVGVDRSPFALDQARAAFAARAPDATPAFLETDAGSYDAGPDAVDAVAWLGGPYVGATFAETLAALRTWVRPGGALLIGQGIWTGTPPPAFLESTGIPAEEFSDHAGLLDLGLSLGLRVLYTCVSSRDEWDHFEGTLRTNSERYALEHPDAPDPHGRLEAGRAFYLAQQRWGRRAMGFALTVFARPLEPSSRVRVRG
jgi:hypothetical protein